MVGYKSKAIIMSDGAVLFLPGDKNFVMPHGIPSEIDIFNIDTIQRYPLGAKLEIDDNVFRYVEFDATTAAGQVLQSAIPDAAHDVLDPSGGLVAAGSKIITIVDSITLVLNEYTGGKLFVYENTGTGYAYFIDSNTAVSAATGGAVTIKHGLAIAIDATSNIVITKSRFKEVIVNPVTATGLPVGVSVAVGAAGSFGWMVTKGPWTGESDGVLVIGQHVRASDGTAGTVEPLDRDGTAEDDAELGKVFDVGADNLFSLINWTGFGD